MKYRVTIEMTNGDIFYDDFQTEQSAYEHKLRIFRMGFVHNEDDDEYYPISKVEKITIRGIKICDFCTQPCENEYCSANKKD